MTNYLKKITRYFLAGIVMSVTQFALGENTAVDSVSENTNLQEVDSASNSGSSFDSDNTIEAPRAESPGLSKFRKVGEKVVRSISPEPNFSGKDASEVMKKILVQE
jgi:hypothetical protein